MGYIVAEQLSDWKKFINKICDKFRSKQTITTLKIKIKTKAIEKISIKKSLDI